MDRAEAGWDEWISKALQRDQFRLRRRLATLRRASVRDEADQAAWDDWQRQLNASVGLREARAAWRPQLTYDESLPVAARRQEIAAALASHQVIVICGETGSGKSTQVPKICLESGRGTAGMIGHTQPRRIAARSIAARLAEELGATGSSRVAYKIRFSDMTREETSVKLMTDGVLLAETLHDRFLDRYDTLILDEAHERSLNIDLLIGLLTKLLPRRPDLKLVLMSATIDADRFAEHFARHSGSSGPRGPRREVPVIRVEGRSYPVDICYRPPVLEPDQVEPDHCRAVSQVLAEIETLERGDVLVFLPTERDIHDATRTLRGHPAVQDGQTELLPLYARLSAREQRRIFQPSPRRRIVLATNVAESSLTVPGIRYVIDTGLARISRYATRSQVQRLPIEPVSQASADQRAGRCGRVGPGVCFRLYSAEDYLERERYTTPEIRRTSLAGPILQTKALRLGPLESLPLLDPPHSDMVRDGYQTLFELGALDEQGQLTPVGQTLAGWPVDPRIGRMILAAREEGCLRDVLVIAAALEIQDPRERPPERAEDADRAHARFRDGRSDFLGWLKLWDHYQTLKSELRRGALARACQREFLSWTRLREWSDIHRQLRSLVRDDAMTTREFPTEKQRYAALHRAILTGLLSGVAYRAEGYEYRAAGGAKVALWPGSGPFNSKPDWIVAAEFVETTRRYARTVAGIDPRWIEPLAEHLIQRSYSDPHWQRSAGTVLATERVTMFGLPVAQRRVPYGRVDPTTTRELFLREGLVGGDCDIHAAFFRHNQDLRAELARHAAKARRADLVVDSATCYDFYHQRLPAEVFDVPSLHRWRRQAEREQPRCLWMSRADLVGPETVAVDESGFPDQLSIHELQLPLEYRFEPGRTDDGITLVVPLEALGQVTSARVDWVVPALLAEKVARLVRSLPKSLRRELPPAEQAATSILPRLRYGEGPFLVAVAGALSDLSGMTISASDFQLAKLPHYLQVYVRVVGERGQTLAAGRDLEQIWNRLGVRPMPFREIPDAEWSRSGLTTWECGDVPEEIRVRRGGIELPAFPTLIDRGNSVDLRLLDSRDEACRRLRRGVRRLYYLAAREAILEQVEWLPDLARWMTWCAPRLTAERLRAQLGDLLADRAFLQDLPVPRSRADFLARRTAPAAALERAVVEIVRVVGPLSQTLDETLGLLATFPRPHLPAAARDVERQLERLLVRDFLTETPWRWLAEFPRYLRGASERLRRVGADAARDRELTDELERLWQPYDERRLRDRSLGRFDHELETYRWMLEEYRVSLFAQTLGTSLPISPPRLARQWERIRRP
ncbi:MAG: ATP-dependent RNA helicase HrpA [Pirellulales bacterium]